MGTIEQSKYNYKKSRINIMDLEYKIRIKEEQIERLKNRIGKIQENNWWGDILIRPVMADVKLKYPHLTWDDKRLCPMGIRHAVSVFGHDKDDKTVAYITFMPGNDEELWIDNGQRKSSFQHGTIGELNGMNNVSVILTDMEMLYEHIERQMKEKE